MVQDIAPAVYHNEFVPREPKRGDGILIYDRLSVLVRSGIDDLVIPSYPDLPVTKDEYLFSIDDRAFYDYSGAVRPEGYEMVAFNNEMYARGPREIPFAAITGYHIHSWKGYHRFCGKCGSPLVPSLTERALTCPNCRHTIYPDIHPAVNVAITDGDRLLMVKSVRRPNGPFHLVAGFMEIGERIEDTVKREVKEEVGLDVTNVRYFASQPWGIVGNLQIGCICDIVGSDVTTLQSDEISEAVWFGREEIPLDLGRHSVTGELICAFRDGII